MARNFYFGADATMVSGSAAFASGINANRVALGLTVEQCDAYALVDAELQSAYLAAITPATRTSVAVARKNAAVKAMQRSAVNLARIINATPGVDDAQLVALGLLPRPGRTRRNLQTDPPRVQVLDVRARVVTIRVCDRNSQSRPSKPFAARGAEIYSYVAEQPPAHSHDYHYEGFASRTTKKITFPNNVPSGATVWISARWISARGETSMASSPLCVTVQGGPVTAAASENMPTRIAA